MNSQLISTIMEQNLAKVNYCLACGASPDSLGTGEHKVNEGYTALFIATDKGLYDIVKVLLEAGANTNERNSNNHCSSTLITQAIAIYGSNSEKVEKILRENRRRLGMELPLTIAIYNDNYEIAKMLLENGADPNLEIKYNCHSIFCMAAKSKSLALTKLLLEHAGDVNKISSRKFSHPLNPLFYSLYNQDQYVFLELRYFCIPKSTLQETSQVNNAPRKPEMWGDF